MFQRFMAGRCARAGMMPDPYRLRTRLNDDSPSQPYRAADRRRDFRDVFEATPAGRRVLAQILDRCRVCDRSFVTGDSLETARREGMRDTGLWLLEILADDVADRPGTAEADPAPSGDRDGRI
jgi:hypothetical protein